LNWLNQRRLGAIAANEQFPWLTLLFLAIVFFLAVHDISFSQKAAEGFNPSEDDLIDLADAGSMTRRIAMLSLGLFGVISLFRNRGEQLRINRFLGWTLALYAGWAALSLTWADDAALTLRRLTVFAILGVAALAIARRCSIRQIILLVFFWSLFYLLIGVCAEVVLGNFHPFTSDYRFAGTQHPNSQGVNCALLLLSGVVAAAVENRARIFYRACALLGFFFLILTASRTAFAAAMVALGVYWIVRHRQMAKLAIPFGLSAMFLLVLLASGDSLLKRAGNALMLGRDESDVNSFNGRSEIWEKLAYYVEQRPLLGYGYGGFFNVPHIADLSAEQNWPVGSAHSAYLECLLDLGFVGLLLYVLAFFAGITQSFARFRVTQAIGFAFSGAFLIFCVTDAFLESIVIDLTLPGFLSTMLLLRFAFVCEPIEATKVGLFNPQNTIQPVAASGNRAPW
jgi:exopolysaccharide production protein ExoQ